MGGITANESCDNDKAYVFTETDKTKSKWVARVYQDFLRRTGRPRTTLRGLFYHALQMKDSEYPICGGFVGEIRIMRPYHEQDGLKLSKWARKSIAMGFVSPEALIEELSEEGGFLPEGEQTNVSSRRMRSSPAIEVWLNKPSLSSLLIPVCKKHGVALVWSDRRPSQEALAALFARASAEMTILTLSDLSPKDAFFAGELAELIEASRPRGCTARIGVRSIGLLPEQIGELKIPLVQGSSKGQKEEASRYARLMKECSLDPGKMAELDALEVYYPGGVAAFLEDALSRHPA
ncbi:hypothetical protein [Methanothrix sp.]|uniref:hypothetical protein n=1 Tax=Methanothrix sp. TaxID=90426 RepID=UPI003C780EEB